MPKTRSTSQKVSRPSTGLPPTPPEAILAQGPGFELWAEGARVWESWQQTGRLTTFGPDYAKRASTLPDDPPPPASTFPLDPAFKSFLCDLEIRGASPSRLLAILAGHEPPKINLFSLYNMWRRWHANVRSMKARRKEVNLVLRVYRRDQQIMRDPARSLFLKAALARERTILRVALGLLGVSKPSRQDRPLSRQAFWTPVIIALIDTLTKAGWTRRRAYRDVARLLHLAFPAYPDQPELIKQRYLRARRDPASWLRRVRVKANLLLTNPIGDGKDYSGGDVLECSIWVAKGLIQRGLVDKIKGLGEPGRH